MPWAFDVALVRLENVAERLPHLVHSTFINTSSLVTILSFMMKRVIGKNSKIGSISDAKPR